MPNLEGSQIQSNDTKVSKLPKIDNQEGNLLDQNDPDAPDNSPIQKSSFENANKNMGKNDAVQESE